jgi:beta-lactam-binding protein with PASTA domain
LACGSLFAIGLTAGETKMQPRQYLQPCVVVLLAVTATAAWAQTRPCSQVPPAEREFARATGACRDVAPIIDATPKEAVGAQAVVVPVPSVVGLAFDDARSRLVGFELRRSYRASAEPGGTVLAQEPAPPARVATGATVRVVLSDGSLRQPPRVAESEIDGVRRPPETPAPPAASNVPKVSVPQQARTAPVTPVRVNRSAETRAAPVTKRLNAPSARTRANRPPAVASTGPTPVAETIEVPNVTGRSGVDASQLLIEFKIDRIEVVASAAPSGQVLAQNPAPGTALAPGSKIGLQVSDGSLAQAAATTPAVPSPPSSATPPVQTPAETSAPTRPPVQSDRLPVTSTGSAALILLAVVLLGLVLGAWLMRRRALGREPAADADAIAAVDVAPADVATARIVSSVPAPEIRVAARLDAGETTIEFTAPLEADETTLEHSGELHE